MRMLSQWNIIHRQYFPHRGPLKLREFWKVSQNLPHKRLSQLEQMDIANYGPDEHASGDLEVPYAHPDRCYTRDASTNPQHDASAGEGPRLSKHGHVETLHLPKCRNRRWWPVCRCNRATDQTPPERAPPRSPGFFSKLCQHYPLNYLYDHDEQSDPRDYFPVCGQLPLRCTPQPYRVRTDQLMSKQRRPDAEMPNPKITEIVDARIMKGMAAPGEGGDDFVAVASLLASPKRTVGDALAHVLSSPKKSAAGPDEIAAVVSLPIEEIEDFEDEGTRNFFSRFHSPEMQVRVRRSNDEIVHFNNFGAYFHPTLEAHRAHVFVCCRVRGKGIWRAMPAPTPSFSTHWCTRAIQTTQMMVRLCLYLYARGLARPCPMSSMNNACIVFMDVLLIALSILVR